MKENCQALGKGQLNLKDVVAAVEDLLYQVDVPKDDFSSFLKGAMADRKKKRAGKPTSSQTVFEKFNCSFEDLFGSDIGAFQDSIHFFDKQKSIATLDLVSQRPQQMEDDDISVSSSSSGILPPPRDTAPRSRAKELTRQKEKVKSEIVASPIKVRQRMSVKSLGRVNSPRRRTRAVRRGSQGPASVMSLDLMHDFSEESKGSSGELVSDHLENNKRRGKKIVVASSQGRDDVAKTALQEMSVKKNPNLPSEKPSRRSEESPRRRTVSPRRTTPEGLESPRRRRRTSRVDEDTATIRSHSVKSSKRTDDRSVSPRRRCDDRSVVAPRCRPKSLTGHDILKNKMKKSNETATVFTHKSKPDRYSDERSVVSRKTTKASSDGRKSDPMKSLVRKASVCKRLSSSDHASPSSIRHNVDPLSKSDHMTRKRLSQVMTKRPN
ncbi:hypothetical protein FisN_8Lh071 [Fistulifera solaris]|uniref:Uncharacterized protein n=1 Tax=Fistulifera solaris TaxID=1519565 RepID=A0A1Z5JDF3_FISSO|nr:hypothetical protein FisN_8Lh071 [Fistulifera solaris]|eukprot:GAX11976.1 hypothetical protein FisN_8Lh071 [Fistulifera solaris]